MPLTAEGSERRSFFGDPELDAGLPAANEAFWLALIEHVVRDGHARPRAILDIGCHSGGLLLALARQLDPAEVYGIEPIAAARATATGLLGGAARIVHILDINEWDRVPAGGIDLIVSHEVLYLEPDVATFMMRVRGALAHGGAAYVVLGGHRENPLWQQWKDKLTDAGHRVYDHAPLEIMEAASTAGLVPSVQPLRRTGWVTYDPLRAEFRYPDLRSMLDHHYRHKLVFRLQIR